MLKEFREFIMRGNVLDMAVGIIIGAAFGGVVTSLVNDVIMPPLGLLLARVDFKDARAVLTEAVTDPKDSTKVIKPAVSLNYGAFINTVINFVIIAGVIFLLVKGANRLKRMPPPPPANTRECPLCLSIIPLKAIRCAHCTAEVKPA